ncbi:MAG: hypothetical protein KA319_04730 [Ferruginibacter sp.]|nr:hypothetical protein [Ferruginibacter sp.]
MNLSTTDIELFTYFKQLDELQKSSLLNLMKAFTVNKLPKNEDYTLQEYNDELEKAMKNIKNGEFITMEELEKEMQQW